MLQKRRLVALFVGVIVTSLLLASCQPEAAQEPVVVKETVPVEETVVVEQTVEVPVEQTVEVVKEVAKEQMRDLEGTITVAVPGAVPVPGAPLTKKQAAWEKVLATYKALQPNVEVEIEDLPEGTSAEVWCETRRSAANMPDISMVENCNYFRPTPAEVEAGTVIATDFSAFEDEINAYTGRPWKDDWINDMLRLARCQEGGTDMWTCQTVWTELKVIFVNWDILNEYGYDAMPETVAELWELSENINNDGEYVAWDTHIYRIRNYVRDIAQFVAMDVFKAAGGDMNDLMGSRAEIYGHFPTQAENYCNKTFWISEWPSLQEAIKHGRVFVDAHGGGDVYFDPTRDPGQLWLTGRAAFWWDSSESISKIREAQDAGAFGVEDYSLEWFPDFTTEDLIDKDVGPVEFDGKFWVEYGGQGDIFAPTPDVRASGEDPNVDLIVRDFFQFLSSPMGQQRILDQDLLPVNPVAMQRAPEVWKKAIAELTPITEEYYQNMTQSPVAFVLGQVTRYDDEGNIEAYWRGDMEFEQAILQADRNAAREVTRRLQEQLDQWGLEEVPEACEEWK